MAENNDNDRTERIRNSRTEDSTKRIYAGKLEIVVDWFRGNFPQYVVDNSLQYSSEFVNSQYTATAKDICLYKQIKTSD